MRKLFFAALLPLLFEQLHAQQNNISLTFQMSLPAGDYKNTYPKTGTGLLCGFLHSFPSQPFTVSIGVEAGLLQLNAKNEKFTGVFRNESHEYIIAASNYIFTISPKLRVDLFTVGKNGHFFIEESLGTNIFFTYAGISHDDGYDILTNSTRVKYDSSAASSYWVLRAAAGIGLEMCLGKKTKTKLLLKCSYVYGGNAKYYSHPTIDQFQITLVPKESKTAMVLAELGFRFNLGSKKE